MSYSDSPGRARVPTSHLIGEDARSICKSLLRDRLISFLESDVPDVAHACFGHRTGLLQMRCSLSTVEPTVNKYSRGGAFAPHTDKQQLTMLLHLSDKGDANDATHVVSLICPPRIDVCAFPFEGSFEGGGTAFWPETQAPQQLVEGSEVVVHPAQGDALFWHGSLTHAARTVHLGSRHVLVCSFSLLSIDSVDPRPYSCMGIPGPLPRHWSL